MFGGDRLREDGAEGGQRVRGPERERQRGEQREAQRIPPARGTEDPPEQKRRDEHGLGPGQGRESEREPAGSEAALEGQLGCEERQREPDQRLVRPEQDDEGRRDENEPRAKRAERRREAQAEAIGEQSARDQRDRAEDLGLRDDAGVQRRTRRIERHDQRRRGRQEPLAGIEREAQAARQVLRVGVADERVVERVISEEQRARAERRQRDRRGAGPAANVYILYEWSPLIQMFTPR